VCEVLHANSEKLQIIERDHNEYLSNGEKIKPTDWKSFATLSYDWEESDATSIAI